MKRGVISMLLPIVFLLMAAQTCDYPLPFLSPGSSVSFSAQPEFVCGGGTVSLTWDSDNVEGLRLRAEPVDLSNLESEPMMIPHNVNSSGVEEVTVFEPTVFVLEIPENLRLHAVVDVVPIGVHSHALSMAADCDTGDPVWERELAPEKWPDQIKIIAVENVTDRDVMLYHAGKTEWIDAHQTSEAWSGLTMSGSFEMSTTLAENEVCPGTSTDPTAALPPILGINITYACN